MPQEYGQKLSLHPPAQATIEGRLLVEAMLGEHEVIFGLVRRWPTPARCGRRHWPLCCTRSDSHLAKDNEVVLPLLAAAPGVSVAELLGDMHELLGGSQSSECTGCGDHSCACGETGRRYVP